MKFVVSSSFKLSDAIPACAVITAHFFFSSAYDGDEKSRGDLSQ
jgi:hypothetical protein